VSWRGWVLLLACGACAGAGIETVASGPAASAPGSTPVVAVASGSAECAVELLAPLDLTSLLQTALDSDALAGYWHADKPGRKPLRILRTHAVKGEPKLALLGAPVVYVDAGGAKEIPYLIVKKVELRGADASVEIEYPVEGIVAFFELKMAGDGRWTLLGKRVVER
jgi:hypothetical protein